MRNIKLTLEYDGTDYVGWQRQDNGVSIQMLLEDALAPIEGHPVTVHGSGRTDAGVHALGQVASLSLSSAIDCVTLARALNAVLPRDVRVLAAEDAGEGFHARFSATGKVYEYRIINAPIASPFIDRYVWHVIPLLDVAAMREASRCLEGTHDFSAFQGAGSVVESAQRTVRAVAWQEGEGHEQPLVMRIEGDGFLRHMVRNIIGTLVEIGLGRRPASRLAGILGSRDRAQAGPTAPAKGLFLVRVEY
jgi:tRNA pseudouridine38-40 synthase